MTTPTKEIIMNNLEYLMNSLNTENKILEGNLLIAKFLNPDYDGEFKFALKWNCDWEWIMTLLDQIEKRLPDEGANKHRTFVEFCDDTYYCTIGQHIASSKVSKIEAIWLACVEFVKWYNNEYK